MTSPVSEYKTTRYLLWAYCLFILYGCFIPFHFNFDPNFVRWRWTVFLTESLREDAARPSLSDIVSNILLFVPFGILSVWASASGSRYGARFLLILRTTLFGFLFATMIECGQTVAPGRDPSMIDALCNGMGTFIGAAWVVCCAAVIGNISKLSLSGPYAGSRHCFCLPIYFSEW